MRGNSDNKKILGDRMPPKKDPKCQNRGEFLQHKGAFLDHKKRDKIDVFKGGGCGAGRPAGRKNANFVPPPDLETARCA